MRTFTFTHIYKNINIFLCEREVLIQKKGAKEMRRVWELRLSEVTIK